MLAEERFSIISSIIEEKGSVTVQQLMDSLHASESTVRRDLTAMDGLGLLNKVHGGAVARNATIRTYDEAVLHRKTLNIEEKTAIARYAASLITPEDFVYIDAGTTTELIMDYLITKQPVFVTNAISHAKKLSDMGCRVYVLGGEFKPATEAIIGEEAVEALDKYNFTKGFWGTNGISEVNGFTTPDIKEAMVKKKSMKNCKEPYVLADSSKFSQISSVKFAEFDRAVIITTELKQAAFKRCKNIVTVKGWSAV